MQRLNPAFPTWCGAQQAYTPWDPQGRLANNPPMLMALLSGREKQMPQICTSPGATQA